MLQIDCSELHVFQPLATGPAGHLSARKSVMRKCQAVCCKTLCSSGFPAGGLARAGVPPRGAACGPAAPGAATTAALGTGGLGTGRQGMHMGINLSFLTALLSSSNGTVESTAIC